MENIHQLLGRLDGVNGRAGKFTARCPGHDDKHSSLSISEAGDKILLKCHAGCTIEEILKPLELHVADLFMNGKKGGSTPAEKHEIERVYSYQDADGKVLFEVVRFAPKGFAQRRPDGQWALGGVKPVLYHLPEVLQAVRDGALVCITEGERDAESLLDWGIIATTAPMGAGKWRKAYADSLVGASRVVVFADADTPGQKHADDVARSLHGRVGYVSVVREYPGGAKDISEYIAAGAVADDIEALIAESEPYVPIDDYTHTPEQASYNLTDIGNADRFAEQWRSVIRFSYDRKRWLVWTGSVWRWDWGAVPARLYRKTIAQMREEAVGLRDEDGRAALEKHADRSEAHQRLRAALEITQSADGMTVEIGELDQQPDLLNCLNGTIDLTTGKLLPHDPGMMLTQQVPVVYDKEAECPRWLQFLVEVTDGNADLITYLRHTIGYSLSGRTDLQTLWFLYGLGNNGKSTLLDILRRLCGPYGYKTTFDTFLTGRASGGPTESIANLQGKRLVISTEVEQGQRLATTRVKDMTGGETINANRKYEHEIEFRPEFKLWLAGNHKPRISDATVSIWRRVKLVPFTVAIPDAQVDPRLFQKLTAELPGILAWAVQGAVAWYGSGKIPECSTVRDATARYRDEQDSLADWLDGWRKGGQTPKTEVHQDYKSWCAAEDIKPLGKKHLYSNLEERGIFEIRDSSGRYWKMHKPTGDPLVSEALSLGAVSE